MVLFFSVLEKIYVALKTHLKLNEDQSNPLSQADTVQKQAMHA